MICGCDIEGDFWLLNCITTLAKSEFSEIVLLLISKKYYGYVSFSLFAKLENLFGTFLNKYSFFFNA